MSRPTPDHLIAFPIIPVFLGGCLALLPESTPVQAQVTKSGFVLAQRTVVNSLPPPPNLQTIPYNPEPKPTPSNSYNQNFQPYETVRVNQYNQNYQPYQTVQANSYSWSAERYIVLVDNSDYQQLQRVRQLERSAFIRNYNGRNVIQSGTFTRQANAQQRVRELQLSGIYGARIVRASTGQQVSYTPSAQYTTTPRPTQPQRSNYYFVIIPARVQDLSAIASRIRQNSGRYDIVVERQQPLGPHVAVGAFTQRSDAERWNDYIRELGYGDARVYYGK
jgi:hypothetical protein